MTEQNEQSLSFEQALAALEEAVEKLEEGGLTLEETLALYERGQQLAAHCERALADAELRLEELRRPPGEDYEDSVLGAEG